MAASKNLKQAPEKSLLLAYIYWLIGGLFGLHHIYLGRDDHAFITLATLGGYFSMGLIRDLWRLPEYVKDVNNDLSYLEWLHNQIRTYNRPPSSLARHTGQMIMGNLLAYLVNYAIPKELLGEQTVALIGLAIAPFASALGVWLVGNVGRHQGSLKGPLIASYLASVPSLFYDFPNSSLSTLAATITFNRYCKKWRLQKKEPRSKSIRLLTISFCVVLYLSLWTSWIYFNCTIEDPETMEPIKCREAFNNFLNSPAYTNLAEALFMLIQHARHQGFMGLWREMMQEFDVSGKNAALATLGLDDSASPQDILAAYKRLSREYHPDRERDPSKKAEKQEKFIQLQQAYTVVRKRARTEL